MDSQHMRTESDGAVFHERLRGARLLVVILVPLLLVATVAAVRATGLSMRPPSPLTAGVEGLAPAELQASAADELTRALAKDGGGLIFEIVQRQTIHAKEDGPLIDIPDPADRSKSLGTTDSHELGTLIERGFATPDGYWMEILVGPAPGKSAEYDATTAETRRSALVREGQAWRNDGTGWYETAQPPGIGLDPATVALLPTLLREATEAEEVQTIAPDPLTELRGLDGSATAAVRALEATTRTADIPGVIAADGAAFTEITKPATLRFDDAGRLVGLTVVARNTNMTAYDLIVETVYSFSYPDSPPTLPEPVPPYVAPAVPTDEEATND